MLKLPKSACLAKNSPTAQGGDIQAVKKKRKKRTSLEQNPKNCDLLSSQRLWFHTHKETGEHRPLVTQTFISRFPESTWMMMKTPATMFQGQMGQKWNFMCDASSVMSGEKQTQHFGLSESRYVCWKANSILDNTGQLMSSERQTQHSTVRASCQQSNVILVSWFLPSLKDPWILLCVRDVQNKMSGCPPVSWSFSAFGSCSKMMIQNTSKSTCEWLNADWKTDWSRTRGSCSVAVITAELLNVMGHIMELG